ncbi:MAG: twin-arginine translocation signal domain-containing protein, partial [Candidatus Alcyoniella australis]|nr:twin-arginine translocation signal domain-containing protein [Candidatus Alcyoniella australis]
MSQRITRRRFVGQAAAAGAALGAGALAGCHKGSAVDAAAREYSGKRLLGAYAGDPNVPKVLLISIDSLDPRILGLDRNGEPGGKPGDWLMPNVREFLDRSTNFEDSRCYLPAATDMNHLNAVAGTHSGLTGVFGVSLQVFDWNRDGTAKVVHTDLAYTRDDRGRKLDTLFTAFKRRWPQSRTLYAAGKGWVA